MEIIPELLVDCYQGLEEVLEVTHPAFQQAWLRLNSFKLREMGSWLMALDTELQTTVQKEIFLLLQDSWKNPRRDKKAKAWYEEPTGPGPSPENGSALV